MRTCYHLDTKYSCKYGAGLDPGPAESCDTAEDGYEEKTTSHTIHYAEGEEQCNVTELRSLQICRIFDVVVRGKAQIRGAVRVSEAI